MRDEPGEQAARERMGTNLRMQREARGLTQEQLAEMGWISRTTISLAERGKCWPRYRTVILLCLAIGCDPSAILGGIRWEPNRTGRRGTGFWVVTREGSIEPPQ